jgi:hypothetical protein
MLTQSKFLLKIFTIDLVFYILISTIFNSSAVASENSYYFIYETGSQYDDALQCEKYIKNNSSQFSRQIKSIIEKYQQKDILNITNILEQDEFVKFKKSLWNCSLYAKYTGEVNYFRRANTDLFEVIINIDLARETGIYLSEDMSVIEENLLKNVDVIVKSIRVSKRER